MADVDRVNLGESNITQKINFYFKKN